MLYYYDSPILLTLSGGYTMIFSPKAEEVLDRIIGALVEMNCPNLSEFGSLVSAILRLSFEDNRILPEFLDVLKHRVWLKSWGSVTILELDPWTTPHKGPVPIAYLCVTSTRTGKRIKDCTYCKLRS